MIDRFLPDTHTCFIALGEKAGMLRREFRLRAVKGFGIYECRGTIFTICSGYFITKGMGSLSQIPPRHAVACIKLLDVI